MSSTTILAAKSQTNNASSAFAYKKLLFLFLTLGFAVRWWNAEFRFLNADEALHYLLSVQPSLAAAYRASFSTVHPPLLIVFLHYWGMLGRSELFLRLPSVAAGTVFCAVMFGWLKRVANDSTALTACALMLFSPALIQLSAEIRQYAFLLLFCAISLYFLEHAITEISALMMALSGLAMYLAMLTHYSSLIFVLTLGAYGLFRILTVRPPRRVIAAWIAAQCGTLALIAILFVTHITQVRARHAMDGLVGTYLRRSVLNAGENPLGFIVRANVRLFHYFFSQAAVGVVGLILFVIGVVVLVRKNDDTRKKDDAHEPQLPTSRQLAFLLVFPLVVNCALGLFRAYPFGGTRHDSYLAIFVFPGIAMALDRWKPQKHWLKAASIGCVLALCNFFPSPQGEYIRARDQNRKLMASAVMALNALPQDSTLLTDDQGGLLLSYYFCHSKVVQMEQKPIQPLFEARCGNDSVISIDPRQWTFKPETFPETLSDAQRTFNLSHGAPLWFFQAGWFIDKEAPLRQELAGYGCAEPQQFGTNIILCQIRLP